MLGHKDIGYVKRVIYERVIREFLTGSGAPALTWPPGCVSFAPAPEPDKNSVQSQVGCFRENDALRIQAEGLLNKRGDDSLDSSIYLLCQGSQPQDFS